MPVALLLSGALEKLVGGRHETESLEVEGKTPW